MGRPLNKRYFKSEDNNNPITLRVKLPGLPPSDGIVVRQKGTRTYIVDVNGVTGTVTLVNKTDANDLDDYEAVMLVATSDGTTYPVSKIMSNTLVVSTPSGVVTSSWVAEPSNSSGIGAINTDTNEVILDSPLSTESDPILTYDTTLSDKFLKDGKVLFAGTGITGNRGYAVCKTNQLELGVTSHRRASPWDTGKIITNNIYDLTFEEENQDFSVTWSVGSFMDPSVKITDVYDVTMTAYLNSDGTKDIDNAIVWNLDWLEEQNIYAMVSHYRGQDTGEPIVDSEYNDDMTSIQNAFRLYWLRNLMVPPQPQEALSARGSFVYSLAAKNKISGLEFSTEIIINATSDY